MYAIPLHRTKGAPVLGATRAGEPGPFGTWPEDVDQVDDDPEHDEAAATHQG